MEAATVRQRRMEAATWTEVATRMEVVTRMEAQTATRVEEAMATEVATRTEVATWTKTPRWKVGAETRGQLTRPDRAAETPAPRLAAASYSSPPPTPTFSYGSCG
jgi:hypothetical protein